MIVQICTFHSLPETNTQTPQFQRCLCLIWLKTETQFHFIPKRRHLMVTRNCTQSWFHRITFLGVLDSQVILISSSPSTFHWGHPAIPSTASPNEILTIYLRQKIWPLRNYSTLKSLLRGEAPEERQPLIPAVDNRSVEEYIYW